METYVRVDPPGEDPERLLDPEHQQSEPWSGTICGRCVELAGERSPDEDFDADEGALLIRPSRVVDTRPLDTQRIARLARQLASSRD
jgi:hypothetical protein